MNIISIGIIVMNVIMGISFIYEVVSRNRVLRSNGINEETVDILNYKKSMSIIYGLLFIIFTVLLSWSMAL